MWGSPLSGKTTYVEKHAKKTDIIWDWDKIKQAVSLSESHQEAEPPTNTMLMKLRASFMRFAEDCGAETAWFICTRPNEFVRKMLGSEAEYIKMDVSKEECYKRLENDSSRPDKKKQAELIESFFSREQREWITKDGKHIYIGVSAKGNNKFQKGFVNKQKRNNHFLTKHKDEYVDDGITTPEMYEKRALELVQSACSDTILGYKNNLDQVVRYDVLTNDYVKGNPKKGIFTMFKPNHDKVKAGDKDAGLRYFNEWLSKEGIETDE